MKRRKNPELTPAQRKERRDMYLATRNANAVADARRLLNQRTAPRGVEIVHVPARKNPQEVLYLWRFDQVTGYWKQERSVTRENADKWQRVFQKDAPSEAFRVSRTRPIMKPETRKNPRRLTRHPSGPVNYLGAGAVPRAIIDFAAKHDLLADPARPYRPNLSRREVGSEVIYYIHDATTGREIERTRSTRPTVAQVKAMIRRYLKQSGTRKNPAHPTQSLRRAGSWIIVDKQTGKAVAETFNSEVLKKLNPNRYTAMPAAKYLGALNKSIRSNPMHGAVRDLLHNDIDGLNRLYKQHFPKGKIPAWDYERRASALSRKLTKVRANPSPGAIEQADTLLESFSGSRASKEIRTKVRPISVGLAVGQMTGVMYAADRGDGVHEYCHRFKRSSRPLLIADHDGKQLGIIGGRFRFTDRGIVDE